MWKLLWNVSFVKVIEFWPSEWVLSASQPFVGRDGMNLLELLGAFGTHVVALRSAAGARARQRCAWAQCGAAKLRGGAIVEEEVHRPR